jgi:hypothetical protein
VKIDYHEVGIRLVVAVVQPVMFSGLMLSGAYFNAYGSWTLGLVLVFAGLVIWLFSIFPEGPTGLMILASAALMITWPAAAQVVDSAALHDRGVRTTCTVLDVSERTETRVTRQGDGNWSWTATTYYDHHLRCADDRLQTMTSSSRAADAGQRLDITFDPAGRVEPQPVDTVWAPAVWAWIGGIALAVSVLLRVIGVLWGRRHPW